MPAPSATPVTLPFSTTLGPYSEPQWYVFTTTEALDFFASTEGSPSAANDTAIALYDSVGEVVAENEDVLGGDYRSRIDVPALPAGTYYLGLTGFPISTGPDWTLSGGESNAGSGVVLEIDAVPLDSGGGGDPGPGGGGGGGPGSVAMDANARLEKVARRTFVPGTPGSPGDPGQPFIPARRVIDIQTVCTYSPYTEVSGVQIVNGQPVPTINPSVYTCRDLYSERIIPAQPYIPPSPPVPATPAQTLIDFQFGWNARARSKPALLADGVFKFRVPPDSVGVMVGLVPQSDPPRAAGFSDIRWGFYVSRGRLRIYENGAEVDDLGLQPNARLALRRQLGQIIYLVNDDEVRTVPNNSVPLVLTAAMFAGGDNVSEAEMVPEAGGGGDGVMRPLQAVGGTEAYAFGSGEMAALQSVAFTVGNGAGEGAFAPMIGLAGDAGGYSSGAGTMQAMTGEAEGAELAPPYAVGSGYFGVMISTGSGLTGSVGGTDAVMAPMMGLGSEGPYAEGRNAMAPMTSYAANLSPPNEALLVSIVVAQQPMAVDAVLLVVMDSNMGLQSLFAVQPIESASMPAAVGFDASWLTTQQIEVMLESVMRASVTVGDPSAIEERSVWVLSLDAMGSTRYEGYDFNSFAEVGGRYFGMRADGLYLLQGQDDNGQKIPARINLGRPNMGDLSRKGLPYVYVGAASDGVLVLKVVADGQTYYYRASSDSAEVRTHRFTPGLGLRATNYDLEIQNDDGGAFDMASIEFVPVKLSRRI